MPSTPGRASKEPCLAAINIEKGILNVLLFLIIAVAGFGILAIFSMIVTEKTRDIGILKALGASNGGVMKIFLELWPAARHRRRGTGHHAGRVADAEHQRESKAGSASLPARNLFDPGVYYFTQIPTDIQA